MQLEGVLLRFSGLCSCQAILHGDGAEARAALGGGCGQEAAGRSLPDSSSQLLPLTRAARRVPSPLSRHGPTCPRTVRTSLGPGVSTCSPPPRAGRAFGLETRLGTQRKSREVPISTRAQGMEPTDRGDTRASGDVLGHQKRCSRPPRKGAVTVPAASRISMDLWLKATRLGSDV